MNIAREILKVARELTAARRLKVYRVGSGRSLDNRNAGDLSGMAKFLEDAEDVDSVQSMGGGDEVTEYEVEFDGDFGPYQYFRKGKAESGDSPQVGMKKLGKDTWYSFPAGGNWKLKKVGRSVPVKDIMIGDDGYVRRVWWAGSRAEQVAWLKRFF